MKCNYCNETAIAFTVIPDLNSGIAWSSHVISEIDGKCGLYHYQCGGVNIHDVAMLFSEMAQEVQ